MGRYFAREYLWMPVTALALLAVYLPGIGNELLFDDQYLASGELFREYRAMSELKVRLLSYGSFIWLQELFGEGWWKQRVVNLLLHVAVTVALWGLYRELLRHVQPLHEGEEPLHRSAALGVAIAFFALNPVAVYAVAYLIQRSILMATLFVVLGLWCFARGVAEGRKAFFAGAVVCFVLAVASKEHALAAPLAAIPVYVVVARPSRRRLALLAAGGALLVAATGAALRLRYGEIIGKPFDEYSQMYLQQLASLDPAAPQNAFGLSILNEAWLFFRYALLWLVPASGWMSINLRPPFPVTWLTFPHVLGILGYLAVLAGGFFLLLRYRDWRAVLALALLLPALLFATEFATVWVQDPFVLYRSYLWAIGVPAAVFLMLHGLPGRVLASVALVVGALLVWQASDRVFSMATAERAWSDAIAKLPKDPRSVGRWVPYLNRGSEYVDANQFALAMRDFEYSSSLGDMGMGAFNKGALLSAHGKPREALAAFDDAERQGYRGYALHFQRAQALLALGRVPEGYQQLEAMRALNPPSPTREHMLVLMGRSLLQLGRAPEAIQALEYLLSYQPGNQEALLVLAMAYSSVRDYARAAPLADRLVRESGGGMAYYARAIARHGLGLKSQASEDIDAAVRLLPNEPNLRAWQAKIRGTP